MLVRRQNMFISFIYMQQQNMKFKNVQINMKKVLYNTSHINSFAARCLINVVYLKACAFIRSWWRCLFLNGVANDAEITQKLKIKSAC